MTDRPTRRRLLGAVAGGLAAALAGCPDGNSTETQEPTPTGTAEPTATETVESTATETVRSTPTRTAEPTATPEPATTVAAVLDGAPAGLRKYRLEISTDALVRITDVRPGLIDGAEFEVVSGGADEPAVAVRAADLSESIGSFDGTETLVTVVFSGDVARTQLDLTVPTLVDDSGAAMDPGRVSLSVSR